MSAVKFKIGDKVRVRKNLEAGVFYGDTLCVNPIPKMDGEILTINYKDDISYGVSENGYSWTDEMLEAAE